jgi:hypothetical protein
MSIIEAVNHWNTTARERATTYPCEAYTQEPYAVYLRAVDVAAPAGHLFRWVCQLKLAPYSYDWIDNAGRRSPRTLTPGADHLEVGQRLMIATIVEFEAGHQITAVGTPAANRLFGELTLTYQVSSTAGDQSRLLACITVAAHSLPGRVRRALLGVGDLVMMRKQLLTLKALAERSQPAEAGR